MINATAVVRPKRGPASCVPTLSGVSGVAAVIVHTVRGATDVHAYNVRY
jgi:hypothetical protein